MSRKKKIEYKKRIEKFQNDIDTDYFSHFEDISYLDLFFGDIEGQADILTNIEKSREFFDLFYDNLDKMIIQSGLMDINLFHKLNYIIRSSLEINNKKFYELVRLFLSNIKTKYPYHKLTFNLLFIRDNYPNFYKLYKETPLAELQEEIKNTLYKLIEEKQEDQFYDYFFDWVLKFGYLIEAYLKEVLGFHLGLVCLLNNKNFDEIRKQSLTVGNLVRKLKTDKTFALYRNSIFHTSFLMHYSINLAEKKITFQDLSGKSEILTIKEFVSNYFKLITVTFTYICSILFHPYIIHKEKFRPIIAEKIDSILQAFTKINKNDFIKKIKEIQEDLDKKFNK